MQKISTADRLNQIMTERGLKQIDILDACKPYCEELGVKISKSHLSQYVSGAVQPGQDKLTVLSRALRVSEAWLMGYDVPKEDSYRERSNIAAVIDTGIHNIPVFESVSAGFGAYASNDIVDYIPVVIKNPADVEDTIAIRVRGDSMFPKIEDGDIIVVRRQTSVDSGDIGVVLLDGDEGLVKKIVYGPTWIELLSLNEEYPVRHFDGAETQRLRVVGKVVACYKSF